MKKPIAFIFVVIFLATIVSTSIVEQGEITYKNIVTNYGKLQVTPKSISETVNPGETIIQEVLISLSTDSAQEFNVTLYGEEEIAGWIGLDNTSLTINQGENTFDFRILVPSNADPGNYQGTIIMNSENVEYTLISIFLKVDAKTQLRSGGSSGGCATEWICSNWEMCVDGKQYRTCSKKIFYCYAGNRPSLEKACSLEESEFAPLNQKGQENSSDGNQNETETKSFVSRITGAVIGVLGKSGIATAVIFLILLVVASVAIKLRKRK